MWLTYKLATRQFLSAPSTYRAVSNVSKLFLYLSTLLLLRSRGVESDRRQRRQLASIWTAFVSRTRAVSRRRPRGVQTVARTSSSAHSHAVTAGWPPTMTVASTISSKRWGTPFSRPPYVSEFVRSASACCLRHLRQLVNHWRCCCLPCTDHSAKCWEQRNRNKHKRVLSSSSSLHTCCF